MDIKTWIRTARKRAQLTQEQLGERLGVTKANVSGWENGRHEASYVQLSEISKISGMPLPEPGQKAESMTAPGLADRIKTILDEADIEPSTLASTAGVQEAAVLLWAAGVSANLSLESAAKIQDKYGYSAVWIVMGKGEKRAAVQHNDDYSPIPLPPLKKIPVVAMAKLGDNGHFCEIEYPVGHGDGYLHFFSSDPNAYGLRCVGDSMEPRIKDGEFVVIEPSHQVEAGDEVLVKSTDGRVMVKTLAYKRGGMAHLLSVNLNHSTVKIPLEDIEHIHFVAAIVKASMWRPD